MVGLRPERGRSGRPQSRKSDNAALMQYQRCQTASMTAPDSTSLAERVARMFPVGHPIPGSHPGVVVDVRHASAEVVLLIRWEGDPRLYGIPISLAESRRDFYYGDQVEDDDEWLDSVGLGLQVMLDTGFRAQARRRPVGDYIELRQAGGWPNDDRFYLSWFGENFDERRADDLRRDGLDPDIALRRLKSGALLAWLVAYENNSTGEPDVGQAVVSRDAAGQACLEIVELTPGVPESVMVDLAYFAAHTAAEKGAGTIATELDIPQLSIAGFETREGRQVLDTSFLAADPDGARALVLASLAQGGRWGDDRDAASRYLPRSRVGRLVHQLVRGRNGRPARIWVG